MLKIETKKYIECPLRWWRRKARRSFCGFQGTPYSSHTFFSNQGKKSVVDRPGPPIAFSYGRAIPATHLYLYPDPYLPQPSSSKSAIAAEGCHTKNTYLMVSQFPGKIFCDKPRSGFYHSGLSGSFLSSNCHDRHHSILENPLL